MNYKLSVVLLLFIARHEVLCNQPKYLEYVDEYFNHIGEEFYNKLLAFGAANVVVDDVSVPTNRTLFNGLLFNGNISYYNGQLLNFTSFLVSHDGARGDVYESGVNLNYHINLRNMTLWTQIDASFVDSGFVSGSGYLFFYNTTIEFWLYMNYTDGNVTMTASPFNIEAPHTNLTPNTELFMNVGRVIRLEYSYTVYWDQVARWCDQIFLPMLKEAVAENPFPIVPPDPQLYPRSTGENF